MYKTTHISKSYIFLLYCPFRFIGLQKLCMLNATQSCVYNLVMLLFRNHLFIWSVFSPKLLYVATYTSMTYVFSVFCVILLAFCEKSTEQDLRI